MRVVPARSAALAVLWLIAAPSCGAPVVHRIPEDFQGDATVVEGTVVRSVPIHQSFTYDCRAGRDLFGHPDWERTQLRVTKVWVGYVAHDTLSVLRPAAAGHGPTGVKPGQHVLAYGTSLYCDADGALFGRFARGEGWRSRYNFGAVGYRGSGDVLFAIPKSEQRDQVASRSDVHDLLRRVQAARQQEALLAPAAIVAVVVRGITMRVDDSDVRCEPVATLAGAAVDTAWFTLHFTGNGGSFCGDGVSQGDTLICPLATVDPPTVPAGHCPQEFRDGGGVIRAYRVARDRVASLFVSANGRLAFRPH